MSLVDGLREVGVQEFMDNDIGHAARFVEAVADQVRYIPEKETWLIWNQHQWKADDDGAIFRLAEKQANDLLKRSAEIADPHQRDREARLALNLGKRGVIDNMLALARYQERIILHAEKLDSDPWLIGTRNGVVNLRTGEFRAGRPEDLISNSIGTAYDPHALCPRFEAFLNRIMAGDAEMIQFLWRIIGYSLTGMTTEQCLFFFYGAGRNGKSTLIEVLAALLGDYGRATAVELILDQNGREPSQLIAALQGKRLVWLPEVEEGHRVAQSRLKTLTGGDRLCGRKLYEREFEFTSTAKLLIHGNSRPEIRGTDLGIWRRFRLIPFNVTIPPEEVDYDLSKKLIQELPGILNRALAACLAWQREGLGVPEMVTSATNEYRETEDVLAEFLEESTILSATLEVKKATLYQAYKLWSEERSQYSLSAKRFGSLMLSRGFKERKTKVARCWVGIGIKE